MSETPGDGLRHERIGTDRIAHRPGYLVVYAQRGMPDWREPGFRKTMVVFRGASYFVRSAVPLDGGRWRYQLEVWPADGAEIPLRIIHYGSDYVQARDAAAHSPAGCASLLVLLFSPLIGFTPRRIKALVQDRFQLDALASTRYSIVLEWAFVLNGAYWLGRDQFGGSAAAAVPEWVLVLGTVGLALLPDLLVRTLHWWQGKPHPHGLYEWIRPDRPGGESCPDDGRPIPAAPEHPAADFHAQSPEPIPSPDAPTAGAHSVAPVTSTSEVADPVAMFGGDRLYTEPEGLLVVARHPMSEWRKKDHRKTLILVGDSRYYVSQTGRDDQGRFTYSLRPWRDDDPDIPGHQCHYTAEFVRERNEWIRRGRRNVVCSFFVWLAAPVLGWLPSPLQARIEDLFGLDARAAVRYSLLLQAGLLVVLFIRGVLGLAGRGRSIATPAGISLEWLLFIVLAADAVLRMIPLLEGRPDPPGLFQWLWRRRRR